jgi:hypothetical protein
MQESMPNTPQETIWFSLYLAISQNRVIFPLSFIEMPLPAEGPEWTGLEAGFILSGTVIM